ncbi:MAG TPA: hypothetical protein VJR89_17675, partial [Polyangiales bacterium]|nr:hypothetical protein [Polyangiales bacterium]
ATAAGTGVAAAGTGVTAAGTGATAADTSATAAGTGAAMAGTGAATAGTGAATAGTGGGAPAQVTLSMVYTMLWSKCALCHAMMPNPGSNGGLGSVNSKDVFYNAVVNKPLQGPLCMGKGMYVVPGKPEMSVLLQKLSMEMPPCGSQMPVGNPLDPAEIKLVSDWIAGGAKND